MRRHMGRTAAGAVTIAMTALLTAVGTGPARAAGTDLGLATFGDIIVDDDHEQVYVSGGPGSNAVVVTDLSGRVIETIDRQYGATGLALSADHDSLYVALAAGDAISVISTHQLAEVARYPTGAHTCPAHLVRISEQLHFGHGCGNGFDGGIGRMTFAPAGAGCGNGFDGGIGRMTFAPASAARSGRDTPPPAHVDLHTQGSVRFPGAPLLTADDGTEPPDSGEGENPPGPLIAAQPGLSRSSVYVYDVDASGGLTTRTSSTAPGSNVVDIAVDSHGETLLTAAGGQDGARGYATADLSGRGSYFTGYHPVAVASSPFEHRVAAGVRSSGDDIYVYEEGGSSPRRRLDISDDVVAPRGVAWSNDEKTVYAVTEPPAGGAPELHVLRDFWPDLP